ncbi:Blp family class II bacteriocin [uncultured Lactobacillus sp.]|uniref:Blp family class II bacteriocin n=1 Tax=uncultured Lactobacillus sp. TaxID=153152 RepID=UPI002805282A|nr:Blp family class II bacteriocin [uncultured Lactobacillus sp.]
MIEKINENELLKVVGGKKGRNWSKCVAGTLGGGLLGATTGLQSAIVGGIMGAATSCF